MPLFHETKSFSFSLDLANQVLRMFVFGHFPTFSFAWLPGVLITVSLK